MTLALLVCDLQAMIVTNLGDHSERRQFQVRGLLSYSIFVCFKFSLVCFIILCGGDCKNKGCAHWRGFWAWARANGAIFYKGSRQWPRAPTLQNLIILKLFYCILKFPKDLIQRLDLVIAGKHAKWYCNGKKENMTKKTHWP